MFANAILNNEPVPTDAREGARTVAAALAGIVIFHHVERTFMDTV